MTAIRYQQSLDFNVACMPQRKGKGSTVSTELDYDWGSELGIESVIEDDNPQLTDGNQPLIEQDPDAITAESIATTANRCSVLYFDIEAVPDYDRQEDFILPAIPSDKPEANADSLMSPEEFLSQTIGEIGKWFAKVNPPEEWLQKVEETEQATSGKKGNRKGVFDEIKKVRDSRFAVAKAINERRKKMATSPEMCRIVSIGLQQDDMEAESLTIGVDGVTTERQILERFWQLAAITEQFCGFNIAGYDLPAIMARSILLNVPSTRTIDLSPHRGQVLDLMIKRFGRPAAGMGLKQLAVLYGIEVPVSDVDGSQVEELFKMNPEAVGAYVESDVEITYQLHRKWAGYFCN